jgi:lysophospholipase L1-like esterase
MRAWIGMLALLGACTTAESAAPPVTSRVEPRGAVLVIGDSLTVGARDLGGLRGLLEADGWDPAVVARTGASTSWGLARVEAMSAVSDVVVVELGTNPGPHVRDFAAEVDGVVAALVERGARRVLWVTPHHADGGRYDQKAAVLLAAADDHPQLEIADWRTVAERHRSWMDPDGIHYTDVGYRALASFMRDALATGRR